jgi:hypothetical protein
VPIVILSGSFAPAGDSASSAAPTSAARLVMADFILPFSPSLLTLLPR